MGRKLTKLESIDLACNVLTQVARYRRWFLVRELVSQVATYGRGPGTPAPTKRQVKAVLMCLVRQGIVKERPGTFEMLYSMRKWWTLS